MKVGFYTPNYPFPEATTGDGIGTYTRHQAHALSALGHEVHVITPGRTEGIRQDQAVPVHVVRCDHFPLVDRFIPGAGACCRVGSRMRKLVRRYQLDVVEFPNFEGLGISFCLGRPAPVVVRLHTSSQEMHEIDGLPSSPTARWDVRRERWLALLADVLVTHSEAHRQRIAAELNIGVDRICLQPHGIPVFTDFKRVAPDRTPLTVVYLGRMEKRKETVDLLQAVPLVLREVAEVQFVLIGADRPHCPGGRTHAQYLEEEIPAEVRPRVQLLGRLPNGEVDRWLQSATVFVAPSLYESFGLIFVEAMRWGIPVVGTQVGGIPEIVEHERTGLLVPPQKPHAIAAALIRLLRDEPLRKQLGEAGRRRVEEQFSARHAAERMVDLYAATVRSWRRRCSHRSFRSLFRRSITNNLSVRQSIASLHKPIEIGK
jgi:glycosyltransferase involved in cell wall biosynthesis